MSVWLCPISTKSWRVVKRECVYGVNPTRRLKLARVQIGDFLIFHVFRPIDGIVAIYKAISDIIEIDDDLWGAQKYPYRIRIEHVPGYIRDNHDPIPLSSFLGAVYKEKGITVVPYLKGVSLVPINRRQFQKLKGLFRSE